MPKHVRSGISVVVLGFTAALAGCSTSSSPPSNSPSTPASPGAGASGAGVTAKVVHTHPTLKTPSFVWLDATEMKKAPGATPVDIATGALHAVAPTLKLSDAVLQSAKVSGVHDLGRGPIITSFRQSVDGIDVFHSQLNVVMSRDLAPVSMTGSLAPSLRKLVPGGWVVDERAAVAKAFTALTKLPVSTDGMVANGVDAGGYDRLLFAVKGPSSGTLTHARAKKVWFPDAHGLNAAWYVELDVANDKNANSMVHAYVVHAGNGSQLFDANMTASDAYTYTVWADSTGPHGIAPMDSPYGNGTTPSPYSTYNANATEPPFVDATPQTLANVAGFKQAATDFWLPANAAELNGNNVHAYADLVAPDGLTPNSVDRIITPTAPGVFGRKWDPTSFPNATNDNIDAVTTDLFFVVNYMHDLFYDSGYDEVSGNAQASNYGRGGVEGDPVNAESQDYSGINNANCSTPADGKSPRIQMYLWDTTSARTVIVNTPGIVTNSTITNAGSAGFGPLATGWDLTGDLALLVDSSGGGNTGCVAASNDLTGKIAVVNRAAGSCATAARGESALAAGAIGMLMYWSDDTTVPGTIGLSDDKLANFPSNIIGLTDGTAIVNALKANTTVNVTLHKDKPKRDGSVDGTIMSHEWGHSLSNRLIGNGSGLGNDQGGGMGEGWSDFVALLTYIRETDLQVASNANWQGAYPEGAYADGGFPTDLYYGIRRYPYSNDMGKNPLTFKYISNGQDPPASPKPLFWDKTTNAEVHNVGEIWASMMWDCYVGLLQDTANYNFATAGQAMRDYLVASLKLTPPSPTMVEARDAVLAVALANKAKPNDLVTFAKAFARRGLGTGAVAPDASSTDLTGVTESFVTGNDIELVSVTLSDDVNSCDNDGVLDAGEVGSLTIKMRNSGIGTLSAATAHVSTTTAGVTFPGGDTLSFPATPALGSATVKFNIRLDGTTDFTTIPIKIDLDGENLVAVPKAGPRSSSATFYANYDFKAASSATDNVDAPDTTWVTSHVFDPTYGVAGDWERIQTLDGSFGGLWFGADAPAESDQRITSPDLVVGTDPFSFTFKHFFAFETDTSGASPIYFDGGVVEISADGGTTWTDLGPKMTMNGYTGQIYPGNDDLTPISGRQAFVGVTTNFPNDSIVTKVDLGTDYAGKTVKVRFRTGSDLGGSFVGWFVDDIAFTGITNTPFASRVANATACYTPVAKIGADQTVNEGASVTLDGSGSSVGPGKTITYQWSQVAGPSVSLASSTTATVSFTAPQVSADTVIKFQLIVSDGKAQSVPAVTTITVKDVGGGGGGAGGAGGHGGSGGTGGSAGGGHHGGCSTAGGDVPASSALPLLALALLGLVLRRRLS